MNRKKVIKTLKIIGVVVALVFSVVPALLYCSIRWMFATWNNLTMDELMYHINAPLDGTNTDMIRDYFSNCVAPTVLLLLVIIILIIQFRHKGKVFYCIMTILPLGLCLVAGIAVKNAWDTLDIGDYTNNQGTYSEFIDKYYADPRDVAITFPEQKRNLIYIFLESMETTYANEEDGGAFKKGCIPELTQLAQENEDFSGDENVLNGGYAMPGATWTVGAMFAHGSGLPLSVSINGNDMDTQKSFFPEAVIIGDVLEDAGYNQTLLIGSDATFGGRRLLYSSHGNYQVEDYVYAKEEGWIPEDYCVWWGYEDEKLFQFAKEQLRELSKRSEPFNLTMLTVDTHFEDGYVCEQCPNTFGDDQYANVIACSSKQISRFVKWIQQQDFYDNTTIVIVGDHPTMDTDFCEDVPEEYQRKVYTSYINSVAEPELSSRREYSTFDNYPTTLAALGASIEGNRLALGVNLFSSEQTLLERFGVDKMSAEVSKKSKVMEKIASIDKNTEEYKNRTGTEIDPVASVLSGEYDFHSALLPVTVTDIQNADIEIESLLIAVWHDEDQNDLTWIQAERQEDGSYTGNVSIDEFDYKTGEYYIDAYVVDGNGAQYIVGSTTGIVE
ncbi:MAG: GBS Bsp-like repeat-containing protein [Hespellia sp.]|nr:GBS Bsp-like repeat-containing protein [Hespellia sp.]